MKYFAATYPKNMINISFDNQLAVPFNKMFVKKFGSVLIEIWIFEGNTFKSIQNHKILSFYRILLNLNAIWD